MARTVNGNLTGAAALMQRQEDGVEALLEGPRPGREARVAQKIAQLKSLMPHDEYWAWYVKTPMANTMLEPVLDEKIAVLTEERSSVLHCLRDLVKELDRLDSMQWPSSPLRNRCVKALEIGETDG